MSWEGIDLTFCASADNTDISTTLYYAYHKKIFQAAYSILGDIGAAEEIVRQTLLIVWERLDMLEETSNFSVWIEEIADSLCRSFLENTFLTRSELP